jgi:hypothetical protein
MTDTSAQRIEEALSVREVAEKEVAYALQDCPDYPIEKVQVMELMTLAFHRGATWKMENDAATALAEPITMKTPELDKYREPRSMADCSTGSEDVRTRWERSDGFAVPIEQRETAGQSVLPAPTVPHCPTCSCGEGWPVRINSPQVDTKLIDEPAPQSAGDEALLKWLDSEGARGLDLSPGIPECKQAAARIREQAAEIERLNRTQEKLKC